MVNLINKVIGVVKYIEPKKATGFGAVAGTIKKPEGYDKDIVFWFSDNKHVMCLANKTGSEEIYPGQKVIFEIREDKKGRFEAVNVHDARLYAAMAEETEEAVEEIPEVEENSVEKVFTEEVIEEEETLVADEDSNEDSDEEESEYEDDDSEYEDDSEEESDEDDSYSKYDDKYFEYEDEYSEVYDDENL